MRGRFPPNLFRTWVRWEGNCAERKEKRDEQERQKRDRIPEIAMVIVKGRSSPSCRGGPADVLG